ncbi:unnamed protein product, partial [Eretmochelys imbricata]
RMQYLKMTMVWNIYYIFLVLFSASLIQQASSQDLSSCAGRCGEGYSREAPCHCDYSCLHYMECCHDYKRFCTEELSCKGRCSETFVRGRECDCDADCKKYGKCCPDYPKHCEEGITPLTSMSLHANVEFGGLSVGNWMAQSTGGHLAELAYPDLVVGAEIQAAI